MRQIKFKKLPKNLKDKTVLLRAGFNEPVKSGKIIDTFRIKSIAPTVQELHRRSAQLIICAHLEGPSGKPVSFAPYVSQIEKILKTDVVFVKNYKKLPDTKGKPIFLENLRLNKGEKKNDPKFAKLLASLADVYVNEAFSVSHRKHASVVGVPNYLPSFAGPLFLREISKLSEVQKPKHPYLVMIGGAKFSTKYGLLKELLKQADGVFVGGALANTFLAAHDIEIGQSVYEPSAIKDIKRNLLKNKKIMLPFDVEVRGSHKSKSIFEVKKSEAIFDIGKETIELLTTLAKSTKYLLWNGPLGFTERGYDKGTRELLKAFAKIKSTKVIIGGGDTLVEIDQLRYHDKFYHVSTGGGAMLDFLAEGTLPGLEAIIKSQKKLK
ncbi:MAG: phosphoglycerate kinase [bacterium]|nr:phosphoglycerate kinase [bacterium]